MPRLMSFTMTTAQFLDGSKTVTRRLKWNFLKPGDILQGVEKAMGLKKGQKIKRFGLIRVVSVRKEPLNAITQHDCILEGFPNLSPKQFTHMLCEHYGISPDTPVNRIEFEHLKESQEELNVIDFNRLSGDVISRFRAKCQGCTRFKCCSLRIRIRRARTSQQSFYCDSISYNSTDVKYLLCHEYKESRRKTPSDLRGQRFSQNQALLEARGQLRLF